MEVTIKHFSDSHSKGEHVLVSGNIKAANPTFLEVGLKQRITVAEVGDNGFGDQIVRALVVKAGLCWYKKHFLDVDYRIGKQEFLRVKLAYFTRRTNLVIGF